MSMKNSESDVSNILVEHYQKTYELTYILWEQRNKTFLILIVMIGIAILLTFMPGDTNSLLVDIVAKTLGVTESGERFENLRKSFPFALLQSILLLVISYLMVNLFHRSLYIIRNYTYLHSLEKEIRVILRQTGDSVAFTRESTFYWRKRPWLLSGVKYAYALLLGCLLLSFLIGRIVYDYRAGSYWTVFFDAIITVPTIGYFLGYVYYSCKFDSEKSSNNSANIAERPAG